MKKAENLSKPAQNPPADEFDTRGLGDQNTFDDSLKPKDRGPQSLGDEATYAGDVGGDSNSLGDEVTFGGDSGSDDGLYDDGMEVVDLESRYTIEGTLGKGGMGEVMLATDKRLDRKVAIKRILGKAVRSTKAYQRFLNGAKTIAALNHPNIVQVYDFGKSKDGPFMILECVTGGSLLDKCQHGVIPLEEAINIACQLCDGIGKAHTGGIVHRDIKPANVLMSEDGVPKLNDFDLAKAETADMGMTQEGAVLGTLDFMPPEQRQDASLVDQRSDLWSLAATLYQMVTGKSPKIIKFKDVPESLHDVLGKALEDEKDDRYQSAREFRDALRDSVTTPVQPAAVSIAELGAGECPECHTKNESSRKFCNGCGSSLRVLCIECNQGIPVWEKFCAECGANQPDLIASRLESLKQQRDQAEKLRSEYSYETAL
ncbi:MAG: serine/threonine-protein kinase, partial [Mariniblastus sp.]|nr:serine/threonine-protein kinase [Mariniblastus sp.]